MIGLRGLMIERNNNIFMIQDCRKEWIERRKDGKIQVRNNRWNHKKDCIIKKCCYRTRETQMGKWSHNLD
jgi:hypothetical protein